MSSEGQHGTHSRLKYFASILHGAASGATTARMFRFGSVMVMGNKMTPRKIQEMMSLLH